MTDSYKGDFSKSVKEDKMEVPNVQLIYRNASNSKPNKISELTSDEETTSSSLLPLPDTLRQMRSELKKIASDAEDPYEADNSVHSSLEIVEEIPNSLEELRKKYSLKNESAVAMKMNSANLMLDDILGNNKLDIATDEGIQSKMRNEDVRAKQPEVESSSEGKDCNSNENNIHISNALSPFFEISKETTSTDKSCKHAALVPVVPFHVPAIPYDMTQHCCNELKPSFHHHNCLNFMEKGLQVPCKDYYIKQRKQSFLEKLQNLQFKYRIQSVYKIVQKNNPFSKDRRNDSYSHIRQSGNSICSKHADMTGQRGFEKFNCKDKGCRAHRYPRRMVFDLIESSDSSQPENKNSDKNNQHNCFCSSNNLNQNECTCPEVMAECICFQPSQEISRVMPQVSTSASSTDTTLPPPKVNEFVQTDVPLNEPTDRSDIEQVSRIVNQKNAGLRDELHSNYHDWKKYCFRERKLIERTDIYYFDHGNSAFYRTTDNHPVRYTECLVERTDEYATKFWGEVFGVIEVGFAFLITFILQMYRFFFTSIIRSLTVGLLQIFSDYFFKPLLTILFNGIIQPCLILAYNIATSLRDLCLPISEIFGFFSKEVGNLFKSCRLIEINQNHCKLPACHCGNKI